MKLLFVTASLGHGGAERHTVALASGLAARGHECHLAYLKDDAAQLARLSGAASVQCLHARRYLDVGALGRLRRLVTQLNPSLVVAVNQYPLLYASLARRRAPLAVTFHTTFLRGTKERLQMLAYRPLFWRADCAIFLCQAQQRRWRRSAVLARRNLVIYNGVDTAHWRPAPAQEQSAVRRVLGLAQEDFVIGASAVLRREKNHVQLVHAVQRLRRRGIPARALMIGDGETRPAVEDLARRLRVAEHLTITGLQRDVRPFLAACDAVALPSLSETFSLAALEAMALAKPVVHADVGGAAEMIEHGEDGLLFPVGDTAALVERLGALAQPATRRRIGERARQTVEARFCEHTMVERYETAFSELATTRSKHGSVRKPAGAH